MKKIVSAIIILFSVAAFTYAQERVITMPEKPNRGKYVDFSVKQTGWWCAAQLSGAFASGKDGRALMTQVDLINGYRFSEFLKVGIGLSPRIYPYTYRMEMNDGMTFGIYSLPIYLDVRGNIISQEDTMFAPYWNFDLGYSINEGVYVAPSLGVKFGGIRHNFITAIFYNLQGHRYLDSNQVLHAIGVRIGYEF